MGAGQDAVAMRDALLDEGVILRPIMTALAVCPPLVMTPADVDRIVETLGRVAARR
jgi:adenosylmethionine-8-amino-7-oxononanoate aminotransferase